ncbi:MAG: tetratricopeptide repeat protein [Betaproteobacteria bacterium]|nr:MAG: tetratricopeptide repeat protein [Betaproteobacteria bacterium]
MARMVRPQLAGAIMLKGLLSGILRKGTQRAAGDATEAQIEQAVRLLQLRDDAGAAEICERLLERDPGMLKAWELLGVAALNRGDYPQAAGHFERALALAGDDAQMLANAAEANRRADRCDRAMELIARALALKPGHAPFLHIQVLALESSWRSDEALGACREALELHPEMPALHTSLMTMLNRAGADPAQILEAHRRWAKYCAVPPPIDAPHGNSPQPERRLRIGYVSADFRQHALSHFVLPLLEHHDPARFEVFCYSNTAVTDDITRRCETLAAQWRDIAALPDAAAEALVRSDGIDILIDLSGHTSGNRLALFARKPAPVQLTYLGYPATTGLAQMDYRLTDSRADLPGVSEARYVERLLRLPHSLWCFAPPPQMPQVGPLPAATTGQITFGSLNSVFKLTPRMLALWSRLLHALPGSKLVLATVPEGAPRARITRVFESNGTDPARLEFHGFLSWDEFWALHGRIDIALDSFPCNGGATTCETLWLGVPLVSLAGDAFLARAGLSLLTGIGLSELVAQSEDEYLEIARDLASDQQRLARLRAGMRERMRASPLLAAAAFTRDLEACYRAVWGRWCENQTAAPDRLQRSLARGVARAAAGDHAAAADAYLECLELQPTDSRIWCNLGTELDATGRTEEAERAYRRALELEPALTQAWYNLGRLLQESGRAAEAENCYREAAARVDADAERALWSLIFSNWGLLLYQQGRAEDSVTIYRRALAQHADASDLGSNLLFTLNSVPGLDPRVVRDEHADWGRRHALAHMGHAGRASRQIIRLGYVSADFCSHALAPFIEHVLRRHDRSQFKVFCYDNGSRRDAVTERVRARADVWRDIQHEDDATVEQAIRADEIDILVDVSGHSSGNRLQLFARKPAPLQVSYLGYLNTTGLSAIDYRITDGSADPAGPSDDAHTERLLRLPHTLWCYEPPTDAPPVCAPPALQRGYVTFASFNQFAKLNPRVLELWANLLHQTPDSRLLVLALPDAAAAARLRAALPGIDPGRVSTLGRLGRAEYWSQFANADIALDPFPYNGGATTCDALWMGVPVVTLAGDYGFSRSGATILQNTGMPQLIGRSADEYLAIARRLAADLDGLRQLRLSLRRRMLASLLLDAPAYMKALEAGYQQIWRQWCAQQGQPRA